MCRIAETSSFHVYKHCEVAKLVWRSIPLEWKVQESSAGSFMDLFMDSTDHLDKEQLEFFVAN